jgi:hypothetical protein
MAIANIVVNDAATPTPIAHTFVPIQDGAEARYVNEAGAMTLKGQETLGLDIKRASSGSGNANVARLTLWDPTEVLGSDGTHTVAYGSSFDLRFNFAQKATPAERKDLLTLAINALTAKKDDMAGLRPQL